MSSTNLLKSLREAANLSQQELATRTGLSRTKVYNLENRDLLNQDETDLFSKVLAETIDLSYVAGLFDRASSFLIIKVARGKIHEHQLSPTYIASISFTTNQKLLADTLREVFGVGEVCSVTQYGAQAGKSRWNYYARSHSVDIILEKMIPYLRLKRKKAILLQEFRNYLTDSKNEYRRAAMSLGVIEVPEQDLNATELLSVTKFHNKYGVSEGAIHDMMEDGRLKFIKDYSKYSWGKYLLYPLKGEQKKLERKGVPMSQKVLDQYEDYYQSIKLL